MPSPRAVLRRGRSSVLYGCISAAIVTTSTLLSAAHIAIACEMSEKSYEVYCFEYQENDLHRLPTFTSR